MHIAHTPKNPENEISDTLQAWYDPTLQ